MSTAEKVQKFAALTLIVHMGAMIYSDLEREDWGWLHLTAVIALKLCVSWLAFQGFVDDRRGAEASGSGDAGEGR